MLPMPYIPPSASFLTGLSVLIAALTVFGIVNDRRRLEIIRERVRGKQAALAGLTGEDVKAVLKRVAVTLMSLVGARFGGSSDETETKRMALIRAGFRSESAPMVFWGVKAALAVMLFATFLALHRIFFDAVPMRFGILGSIALALIGLYAPEFWLKYMVGKRAKASLNGLPDALDLLVVSVESGMGLDQAIYRVGVEMEHDNKVIAEEFKSINLELRAGKSRADCLRNLALRMGLEDVDSLVTLLIQSDTFGTSVAQTLRVYSDTLRTKRFQKAEEIAAKLPVKLMLPLILLIFPALFVVIGGPSAIALLGVISGMK